LETGVQRIYNELKRIDSAHWSGSDPGFPEMAENSIPDFSKDDYSSLE
jgi:hypothetical protein